jgi:hypothetical protein
MGEVPAPGPPVATDGVAVTSGALKLFVALVAALGVAGCFSSGALYRQPATQETRVCAGRGFGSLGIALAAWDYLSCKHKATSAGFVRERKLTQDEIACAGLQPNAMGTCSNQKLTR